MESVKRYALEVVLGALLGGAVGAMVVPALVRQGVAPGPWVLAVAVAAGIGAAVWFGESVYRAKRRA
jgi:hypothetical protein